ATKNKATIIFHCSIPKLAERNNYKEFAAGKTLIATSVYSGQQWALYLDIPYSRINIVLPFADPIFSNVKRSKPAKKTRILFAGRLHPEKGVYTLLEMMHQKDMRDNGFSTSIVAAGLHVETGRDIVRMLKGYPYAKLIPAQKTVASMAQLLAKSDILLMPSVFAEPFGMLSVEAQHAGCRVVASNIGGLPETNCGLLTLVAARSPLALLTGVKQAVALGASTKRERDDATSEFTLSESVDDLLGVLRAH
ncbi:MAG TPA: glycosyltransferase, partial [Candidatus Saccharimonadales bacterium]|nr:glycosyltransferase [Candidatus Saccharimonadales bacterium]